MHLSCGFGSWRSSGLAVLVASALGWAGSGGSADETPFRAYDGFEERLDLEWNPIRPNPTHVSLDKNPGKLTITTETGSIHLEETGRNARIPAKNLYLVPNPAADGGDFALTTCIESFHPSQLSHQAGLLVYDGDDNYVKWVIECSGARPRFNLLRETDQQSTIEVRPDVPEAQRVWLRLIKRGNCYQRSYSTDGEDFIAVGERQWGSDTPKWVGILAKNGSTGGASEIDAVFDFFEARSLTDAEANDPHYLERRKLQGSWEVVECRLGGKPVTSAPLSRFAFDGTGVVITERTQSLATEFTLDVAKNPKGLTLAALSSRTDTPARGVYSVEADTLVVCLGLQPDAPPPAALKTEEGDGRLLVTLRRIPAVEVDAIERNAQPRQRYFRRLDKDGDERLTGEEFLADYRQGKAVEQGTEVFTILDRDGDTKLTFRESAYRPSDARFWDADEDGDDRMALDEFKSGGRASELGDRSDALFTLIDRNHDGHVSLAEYRTQPDEARFPLVDLDGDQSLSLKEFIGTIRAKEMVTAAEKSFKAKDENADGSLSFEEFRAGGE